MQRTNLLIVFLISLGSSVQSFGASGQDLLVRSRDAFAKVKSLDVQAEFTAETKGQGFEHRSTSKHRIALEKPRRLHIESKGFRAISYISDGQSTWLYHPFTNEHKKTSGEDFMNALSTGIADFMNYTVIAAGVKSARVVGDGNIDIDGASRPCSIVDVEYDRVTNTPGIVGLHTESTVGAQGPFDYSVTNTVTPVKIDQPLASKLFVFHPPAAAKRVDEFNTPKSAPPFVSLTGKIASECKDVVNLDVNVGEDPDVAGKFVKELSISYPTLVAGHAKVVDSSGAQSLPTTVVVDRECKVVLHRVGLGPELEPQIRAALAGKPAPAQAPSTGAGVYRVGGDVTAPSIISKREPGYTEEARRLHMNSTVVLFLIVGEDGLARDIKVLRAAGAGLDEQAIESVKKWRFKPGQREGKPVSVQATIEVNFRLLDDNTWLISRVVFDGKDRVPHALNTPLPDRPIPNVGARVTFHVVVDASGHVNLEKIDGADALGPAITGSLEQSVQKWKFKPAERNGEKVEAKGEIELIHGTPPPPRNSTTAPAVPVTHLDPKDADEAYREGSQTMRTRQFAEAVRLLTKALEFKADWPQALALRAQAQFAQQHYPEAIRDLNEAIKLNPNQASLYDRRGTAYSYSGQHEKALSDHTRAIELNQNPSASYYANRGWDNLQLGDADKAVIDLTKAIEITPDFARAYANRASAYLKLADYAKSIADYSAAIQLTLTPAYYEGRSEAKRASGDFNGAEEDQKRARELPTPQR